MIRDKLPAENNSILLDIDGMKCGSCVRSVEQTLLNHSSVLKASVNLVTGTAYVDLKNESKELDQIIQALNERGFSSKQRIESNFIQKTISEKNID